MATGLVTHLPRSRVLTTLRALASLMRERVVRRQCAGEGERSTAPRAASGLSRSAGSGEALRRTATHPGPRAADACPFTYAGSAGLSVEAPFSGEVREVSIVMADLRGFTAFCERAQPTLMWSVLNEYLTAMIDVIMDQQGHVQDFVGDGILGVFGAPDQDPDHAWHAVLSALEMQAMIRRLGDRWRQQRGTSFGLGVAVHTGEVFAGAVGSPRQAKYAVVGDPVNTVSRLEELNRDLGTEIVMSAATLGAVRDRVDVHPRGSFAIRGRSHAVEVFELRGINDRRDVAAWARTPPRAR